MGWADARDNVALPLVLRGMGEAEARQKAVAALAECGLSGFERARPSALSGGMKMRCALARALVTDPEVLLLDEPFAAIDELGRRELDDLLLDLRTRLGRAMVFVTHSVEEAVYVADRVLVMSPRPGRIVETIAVDWPKGPRGTAFMTSAVFAQASAAARRTLAGVMSAPTGAA